jgi:hypothetical protein
MSGMTRMWMTSGWSDRPGLDILPIRSGDRVVGKEVKGQ